MAASMFISWAVFLLSAAVIVYAGTKLSRYGDQIATLTGLGGLWIGVVLMAAATSLPEIFTTVSAGWLNTPVDWARSILPWGISSEAMPSTWRRSCLPIWPIATAACWTA